MKGKVFIGLVLVCITIVLSACSSVQKARVGANIAEPFEYRIGPEDVLSIIVWRQPEFTLDIPVDSRGILPYPLLGDLEVIGKTTYEVADVISEKLTRYIKNPQVRVEVKEFKSQRFIIIGEINKPGLYYVKTKLTVLEAICMAGNYTDEAVLSNVQVARGNPNSPEVLSINLKRVIFKNERSRDIILQSGDIVYVPKSLIGNINYAIKQITPSLRTYYLMEEIIDFHEMIRHE